MENYMTVEQVATKYGVTDSAVRKWILRGLLPAQKEAGVLFVKDHYLATFKPPGKGGTRPGAGRKKKDEETNEN